MPQDLPGWLREVAAAYCDAREAISFSRILGEPVAEVDLFHLAPQVTVKFRGLRSSATTLKRARDAALASYVANRKRQSRAFADPRLAFAFAYLASHYGLGLVEAEEVDQVMDFIQAQRGRLRALTGGTR